MQSGLEKSGKLQMSRQHSADAGEKDEIGADAKALKALIRQEFKVHN